MSQTHQLQCAHSGERIVYELKRTRRKNLGLYIYPDGRIQVRAPTRLANKHIHSYVQEMSSWIAQQLAAIELQVKPVQPQFLHGHKHFYCGEAYVLQVQAGSPQRLVQQTGELHLFSLEPENSSRNEALLYKWYRQQANELFTARLSALYQAMFNRVSDCPELKIRRMKSRWGSCSSKRIVTLNLELICKDPICLDYVIQHELCHLIEMNHSPRFYALMDKYMPKWRQYKELLNNGG